MLKDAECAARYEESLAATDNHALALPNRQMIGPAPTRDVVTRAQEMLAPYKQEELPPEHYFAAGMYGRRLDIPADMYVVAKIHRHEHIVMLLSGEVTINTDRGMERVTGPCIWISPKGAKRILHTHTDCAFFTCHLNPSDTTDLDALEAELIEPEKGLLA